MYLDYAVQVLSSSFPNSWNGTESSHQQAHGSASWKACSAILPHISWLIKLAEAHSPKVSNAELLADLTFRAGT